MATNKTTETTKSVTDFINKLKDETQKKDSLEIIEMMNKLAEIDKSILKKMIRNAAKVKKVCY